MHNSTVQRIQRKTNPARPCYVISICQQRILNMQSVNRLAWGHTEKGSGGAGRGTVCVMGRGTVCVTGRSTISLAIITFQTTAVCVCCFIPPHSHQAFGNNWGHVHRLWSGCGPDAEWSRARRASVLSDSYFCHPTLGLFPFTRNRLQGICCFPE